MHFNWLLVIQCGELSQWPQGYVLNDDYDYFITHASSVSYTDNDNDITNTVTIIDYRN